MQVQIRKENRIYLITLKLVVDIVKGSVAQQGSFYSNQQFVTIENKSDLCLGRSIIAFEVI